MEEEEYDNEERAMESRRESRVNSHLFIHNKSQNFGVRLEAVRALKKALALALPSS